MLKNFIFLFCLCFSTSGFAQSIAPSTLNAAGGSQVVLGTTVEWSIGEMVAVNTATTNTVIVTQGLLQPSEIKRPDGVVNTTFLQDKISVYPNPSSDVLTIGTKNLTDGTLEYILTDIQGKVIIKNDFNVNQQKSNQEINISSLAASNYLLKIGYLKKNNLVSQTLFKIQKNK
jgi:hypothetical protein